MNIAVTVDRMIAVCRATGTSPKTVFDHLDEPDVEAYAGALNDWLDDGLLARILAGIPDTVRAGRCLCRACKLAEIHEATELERRIAALGG